MYPDSFKNIPTKRTPWIILEPGRIFIMGRSIPENPNDFYRPIQEWISKYVQNNTEKSKIELGFEYINTSSIKWIFTILRELSEMKDIVNNASVTWYYEHGDEDMCELGFILRSLVECPFVVVEVDEMNRGRYENILSTPT
jgi:SiaC family regulatory phosphoprotein